MEKMFYIKNQEYQNDNGFYPNPATIFIHINSSCEEGLTFLYNTKKSLPPASHRISVNNRLHQLC